MSQHSEKRDTSKEGLLCVGGPLDGQRRSGGALTLVADDTTYRKFRLENDQAGVVVTLWVPELAHTGHIIYLLTSKYEGQLAEADPWRLELAEMGSGLLEASRKLPEANAAAVAAIVGFSDAGVPFGKLIYARADVPHLAGLADKLMETAATMLRAEKKQASMASVGGGSTWIRQRIADIVRARTALGVTPPEQIEGSGVVIPPLASH